MNEPQLPISDDTGDPNQPTEITVEKILDVLTNGKMVTTHGLMRYSSNYTFLVTVEKDEYCLPAIYKPRKGERPLWDFPTGTLYRRERAAFLTSETLGWNIVPPTVVREGEHGVGSLQFYVDHDPDQNYFTFDDSLSSQIYRLCLFDVLANNADRKAGHCLLDANQQVWGIDHGLTFNEDYKLRTVVWDFAGQSIPPVLMEDIKKLCDTLQDADNDYYQAMSKLLSPREIAAYHQRIERVIADPHYPTPGPGPNYPWPAV